MRLNDLKVPKGSKKERKRIGRGTSSGSGKTSGKGHGGQKSRSGYKSKPGFEGGQMPIQRKVPKRGMSKGSKQNMMRHEKTEYVIFNTSYFNKFQENTVISEELLLKEGIIKPKDFSLIKVLSDGKLEKKLSFSKELHFSKSAEKEIQGKGGEIK
ncbi:50S ribosomal protein L15 [bacterium]|nr:50S ribosomal protein L15 [bacterium]